MKTVFLAPDEIAASLGEQLRKIRLLQNLTQAEVAARAGIALNAVKRLESGEGATVATLIGVLRVFGRTDWLTTLAPTVTVSPMQMLTNKSSRRRARSRK